MLKENYPELSDREILQVLKDASASQREHSKTLEKYGYDKDYRIEANDRWLVLATLINFAIVSLACIVVIVYYLRRFKSRDESISMLTGYLDDLSRNIYDLDLSDNSEDEITLLKNEIYKTTVSLRETAELSQKERKALSCSLEDISHQLKTPLTSIRVMLDNILDDEDMPVEVRRDFLESISRQLEWIQSLVISLLKLARFDAGTIKLKEETVVMDTFLKDSVRRLAVITDIKNVNIALADEEKLKDVTFKGDYKWQLEAVTNIIKNAVEHSPENSTVKVSAEKNSIFTRIRIEDSGDGISEKDLKHIFERFYKAENSGPDSVGIGLSLAKSIIESAGGYITVSSEKGSGTVFEITYN